MSNLKKSGVFEESAYHAKLVIHSLKNFVSALSFHAADFVQFKIYIL